MKERVARIRSIEPLVDRVVAVDLEALDPPSIRFSPGQFVSVRCGPRARRSFSVTSEPGRTDGLELMIKRTGSGTTARFYDSLEVGSEIRFYGPMGYFLLQPEHPGDVVFAATGVGISAIYPMVREAIARPESGRVLLLWGLRRPEDVFWRDRLEKTAAESERFRYEIFLSSEGHGRITPRVLQTSASLREPVYYLCGNGDMIEEVKGGLVSDGVDRRHRVHTEIFYPAARGR